MKKTVIILMVLVLCGSWIMHKFYVSLTEIRYNPQSKRIEVSMRVFPDDLDLALKNKTGIATHLATEMEPPKADSMLMEYIGKESEGDAIWCYLESEQVSVPETFVVLNAILTETFENQVNIIQVYQNEWNKGLMLNRDHNTDKLTVGE